MRQRTEIESSHMVTVMAHHARVYADATDASDDALMFTLHAPDGIEAVVEFDGCHEGAEARVGVWFVRVIRRPCRPERIVRDRIGWLH